MKLLILLAVLTIFSGPAKAAAKPAKHIVLIENMLFTPAELTVKAGESIEWENRDLVPHTVTAKDGSFDSKAIAPGKKWRHSISGIGPVAYKCIFHPTMSATIVVK